MATSKQAVFDWPSALQMNPLEAQLLKSRLALKCPVQQLNAQNQAARPCDQQVLLSSLEAQVAWHIQDCRGAAV